MLEKALESIVNCYDDQLNSVTIATRPVPYDFMRAFTFLNPLECC